MKKKKLRIAILGSVFIPCPPKKQGGTEWVVYYQANGLCDLGHDVTLFAIKGSKTRAKLVPIADKGAAEYTVVLSKMESSRKLRLEMSLIARAGELILKEHQKKPFDVIFNHIRGGETMLPLAHLMKTPLATIMHLPVFKEQIPLYKEYKAPLIPIGKHQKKVAPGLNYTKVVHNGVDDKKFTFNPTPKDYFLCITTIGEHKNTGAAVKAALKARVPLILAGKVRDKEYFAKEVEPYIDGKKVKYLGQIGFKEKIELYRNARGFLFPTIWAEPFGLVGIEALACGTPVIGWRSGALPEIIEHGKNGYLVNSVEGMVRGIKHIDHIDRAYVRKSFIKHFTHERVIRDYEEVAYKLAKRK